MPTAAPRAHEPLRPAQPLKVSGTARLVHEPALELTTVTRVVDPGPKAAHNGLEPRTPTLLTTGCVKGIAHCRESGGDGFERSEDPRSQAPASISCNPFATWCAAKQSVNAVVKALNEIATIEAKGWSTGTLQPAYDALLERWQVTQDRETGLRLLFLAWYSLAEPELHTGLAVPDAPKVASNVVGRLELTLSDDAEFLLVTAHMISVCPWGFDGDERTWTRKAMAYRDAAQRLEVTTLEPKSFEGRGAYGAYFTELWTYIREDETRQ